MGEQYKEIPDNKEEAPLEEIVYEEDGGSRLFDSHLRSRKSFEAVQKRFTPKPTEHEILTSGGHRVCHDILVRTGENKYQLFHIQPTGEQATLLTFEQEKMLKQLGKENSSAITISGGNSWISMGDIKELEEMGILHEKTVDPKIPGRWKLLYDPDVNEIWIDNIDAKILRKYKGFAKTESK